MQTQRAAEAKQSEKDGRRAAHPAASEVARLRIAEEFLEEGVGHLRSPCSWQRVADTSAYRSGFLKALENVGVRYFFSGRQLRRTVIGLPSSSGGTRIRKRPSADTSYGCTTSAISV